jgi:hypothetical protein
MHLKYKRSEEELFSTKFETASFGGDRDAKGDRIVRKFFRIFFSLSSS